MKILEHQHHRPADAEPPQQAENQLQELRHLDPVRRPAAAGGRLRRGVGVKLGQQPAQAAPGGAEHLGQLAGCRGLGQRAQRVDERGKRQALGAELDIAQSPTPLGHLLPGSSVSGTKKGPIGAFHTADRVLLQKVRSQHGCPEW